MIVEIKNKRLTAKIKTFGAELTSLVDNDDGTEYIWCGDGKYWPRQAPLLFPIVGKLADDTALIDGVKHNILIHGFIRDYEFSIISKASSSVTLECMWNEETFARYPYKFSFQVTYSLEKDSLTQSFYIKNLSDKAMPFCLGGHTGFNCPLHDGEKFEDYRIEFIENPTVKTSQIPKEQLCAIKEEESFDLDYDKFSKGAFIYENLKANSVRLINKSTKKGLSVSYKGFPLLGIWTPESINSPFVCIEPWLGMTDKAGNKPIELKNNPLSASLEPGKYSLRAFIISIL